MYAIKSHFAPQCTNGMKKGQVPANDMANHLLSSSVMQQRCLQKQQAFASKKRNHNGMPEHLQAGMERVCQMNLDHVQVHYNSHKPAAVQAHAYAQGNNIYLARGQEKHLPHELGHVVQQMQGRVNPTKTLGGVAINDNPALEREADHLGSKALQMASKPLPAEFQNHLNR